MNGVTVAAFSDEMQKIALNLASVGHMAGSTGALLGAGGAALGAGAGALTAAPGERGSGALRGALAGGAVGGGLGALSGGRFAKSIQRSMANAGHKGAALPMGGAIGGSAAALPKGLNPEVAKAMVEHGIQRSGRVLGSTPFVAGAGLAGGAAAGATTRMGGQGQQ